jgi:hypothetical protein
VALGNALAVEREKRIAAENALVDHERALVDQIKLNSRAISYMLGSQGWRESLGAEFNAVLFRVREFGRKLEAAEGYRMECDTAQIELQRTRHQLERAHNTIHEQKTLIEGFVGERGVREREFTRRVQAIIERYGRARANDIRMALDLPVEPNPVDESIRPPWRL